jgi:hypothetical protein
MRISLAFSLITMETREWNEIFKMLGVGGMTQVVE